MSNRLDCTRPGPLAEALWQQYGDSARLHAALSAFQALQREDLSACALWRDVMDLLEERSARDRVTQ